MRANIHEDPNVTLMVSYSRGDGEDGGWRVERADASTDRRVQVSTQGRGGQTQKRLSAVQRKSLITAALTGSVIVLLVVGVIVLSRLYISVIVENQRLNTNLVQLQTSYQEVQTSYQELETSPDKNDCQFQDGENWKRFRCSCYFKSTEKKNWTESRRDCQSRGADLVIIKSKAEQDFVAELDQHETSWIGLQSVMTRKDWEVKFEWSWVDGSAPRYLGWRRGVYTAPVEEGSVAYIDQPGSWNHTKEGLKHWICEKPM